jgi:small-conductance mechanosensitive channel
MAVLGVIGHALLFYVLRKVAHGTGNAILESLGRHLRAPSLLFFPALSLTIALPLARIAPAPGGIAQTAVDLFGIARQALGIVMTVAISWMVIESTSVIEDAVLAKLDVEASDNLRARKIKTQLQVFKKVIIFIVAVFALALVLMNFERVRQLGTTILASAGVIGIIVGFAAQRTIAALLAGIQIAITQPFRIDDVLVVENEWGKVEEITLTYVVVKIWDLRRLVLPMSYFLEKPFQNWTRTSADLLGTVFIRADYAVPVAEVRDELHRILENSPLWDGKVWNLQVTDATDRSLELRALMSASDASSLWDLRCEVRERLVEFVQREHPEALPKVRGELVRRKGRGDQ